VQRRAAGWGFEWRTREGAMAALREEVAELERAEDQANIEEEIGDVLFSTVALARRRGVDPVGALRRTTNGFARRYERFMQIVRERGLELDEMSEPEIRELFRQAR
jgi:uncharacterized protein YabN with tetrapyrrole methylase and pyrophosphatase domain